MDRIKRNCKQNELVPFMSVSSSQAAAERSYPTGWPITARPAASGKLNSNAPIAVPIHLTNSCAVYT